jgi:dephospho-CoA kinase
MRVALTGGIASGKSTVGALLRDLGAVVIESDRLARDVVAPGTPGLVAVVEAFGPGVLTASGELDRPAVARTVFADAAARRRLEGIVHPLVHEAARRQEAAAPTGSLVVHDIPLLVEVGRAAEFDVVVVVDCPEELQVERMVTDRGWSRDEALSRVRAQAGREGRLAVATHVIENTGSLEQLRTRVAEVHAALAPPRVG